MLEQNHPAHHRILICAAAASAERDVTQMLARLRRALFGWARRRLRSESAADDFVQDVLERALRRMENLRDPTKLAAWTFALARFGIARHMRKLARSSLPVEPEWSDDAPTTEDQYSTREHTALLRRLIAALPDQQRRVVLLRVYEELDVATIARRTHATRGTTASRLRLAQKRLQQMAAGQKQ